MGYRSVTEEPAGRGWFERGCLAVLAGAVVLVTLIRAKAFLVPLVVALLLFSLASAMVDAIVRWRIGSLTIPRWLATLIAGTVTTLVLLVLVSFGAGQVDAVRATLPAYIERGEVALARLFAFLGEDISRGMLDAFRDIDASSAIRAAAGSAGNLLTATILVALYVGFLFSERPFVTAKLARLFPDASRARRVTRLIVSIRERVHHYMLVKTVISAITAAAVYVLCRLFGLDFAEFLAVATFLLNFIPTLGSIVATFLPVVIALVQFDSLPAAAGVLASVGTVQFVLGNIVDPMMTGRALQMSSFAIILSLTLWSALWGVIGMFLAVPIMVMILIVCTHVPALRPFAILLSRDGDLPGSGRAEEPPV